MQEMRVLIFSNDYREKRGYQPVRLELPAGKERIADALQRAHVKGTGYSLEYAGWPYFLTEPLEALKDSRLEEANLLAYQIQGMDEEQLGTFEGAVALRMEEDAENPVTMKELINFTYNLGSYDYYPGVRNDTELGEICIEGEMMDFLKRLPDDVIELLDPKKVGEELRRGDQGTFTLSGYVFRNGEDFQEIYGEGPCPDVPDRGSGILSVRLISLTDPDGKGVWLELPAGEEDMRQALDTLKADSFDCCLIAENRGSALPFSLAGDEDMEKLNLLAERVQKFPDNRTLAKYKAALELELCNDLDLALDIAANLDCYSFDQEMFSPARYAEYLLEEAGFDTEDPAFRRFDFEGYGERKLKEIGFASTAYGVVARNEVPFRQEYSAAQQGMKMQ